MKYLGIDFGTKRVGIAISDDTGVMAFPKTVLRNNTDLIHEVVNFIQTEKVEAIVIGESKNFDGVPNPIMKHIETFIIELKKETSLPIHMEPELFSSMEAEHIQGSNTMNDASAAAIILKSYIDKHHGNNN